MDERLKALGPVALDVVRDILLSGQVAPQTRLQAARDVLDRLGWVPPRRAEAGSSLEPDLEELSLADLHRVAAGDSSVQLDVASMKEIVDVRL